MGIAHVVMQVNELTLVAILVSKLDLVSFMNICLRFLLHQEDQ